LDSGSNNNNMDIGVCSSYWGKLDTFATCHSCHSIFSWFN